ncbi:MAG TPA: acyltransferase [Polyangiaceae bacterium]|nr:acyltransferase [Polyangiaceae bacterium]
MVDDRFRNAFRFPGLDALRGISILAVLWHHATPRQLAGVLGRGHLGVQLFFSISGFLITTLLLRERRETGDVDLSRFWVRRALRLFPLYYVTLAGFVAFAWALPTSLPERAHFFQSLPFYVTHTANWFVDGRVTHPMLFAFAWSLSTEQQFYLVWPSLIKRLREPVVLGVVLVLLIVADQLLERRALGLHFSRSAFFVLTSFSASIALGALAALLLEVGGSHRRFESWRPRAWLEVVCTALVAFGVLSPPRHFIWFEGSLALLVACAALAGDQGLWARLAKTACGELGRRSYGVYLFHVPVLGALRWVMPGLRAEPLPLFLLAVPVCWALAELSHQHFEARFLARRPRLERQSI